MNLETRLSSALSDRYILESELGAGGMATVYLAQDLKHDRKVAVKVLRPELAAVIGADRFLTEIKTTANLQHPHILPLFDSGAADGFLFYVMPWVQGETVRDRITREKQLPIADALRITTEVAAALDYAHRHGVIHRDIKPENILLHDGSALVADFGIALAASKAGGSTRMTETGMSLGTPHYMSPEQAMGEREITARSDVYALGCVLYEMLTGDPPFTGSTAQAIVARVVTEAPRPMVPQRHTIPPYVEAAVLTALEKLPADRFASAKEFADALDGKNSRYAATVLAPGARPSRLMRLTRPVMISALALTATAAGLAGWLLHEGGRADAPVSRYPVSFPEPKTPDGPMAFTADGSRLVYRGPADTNGVQLWLKNRDLPEATPIPGTANAIDFAISPDGRSLAVLVDGRLERMPIAGGPVTVLTDSAAIAAVGPVWLDDDTIIYSSRNFRLMRIAAGGGAPTVLYTPDSSIAGAAFPAPLPDGRGVLFLRCSVSCLNTDLAVLDFKSGKTNVILTGARRAWYLPSGHLVFVNGTGDLFAADFDLKTRQVRGSPVQVQRGVSSPDGFAPATAISGNGTLLMRQGNTPQGRAVPYELVWVDRAGQQVAIDPAWTFRHSAGGGNVGWSLSPDGRQVAIGLNTNSGDDVWLKRIPTGPPTRLTFDSTTEQRPRWTPDGQSVTYIVVADSSLHQRRADGTGADRNLVRVPGKLITAGAWSPDGKWLVIRTGGIDQQVGGRDIVGFRPGIDTAPVPLAASPRFDEAGPMVSPDGKWLAYESDETGRTEVYIRPFPNVDDGRWQVSLNGGQSPLWAHNRKEIFFVDADRNLVAVPIIATAPLQLGERNVLFRMGPELFLTNAEHYTPFDISLDDKRFLMARRVRSATEPPSFLLVENWFTELKSKVATK